MAAHSSILAWKISRTEKLGKLQSMGSQRVIRDLVTKKQKTKVITNWNFWKRLWDPETTLFLYISKFCIYLSTNKFLNVFIMLPPSDCIYLRNCIFIYIKYMPIHLRKDFASSHLYYLVIKDIATVLNSVCMCVCE